MIETGPSCSYVYVSKDELNGHSLTTLQRSRDEVAMSDASQIDILTALDEIIATPDLHEAMVEKFQKQGRFLLAIDDHMGFGVNEEPVDGFLYAQAEGEGVAGDFSLVRVATWIRQGRSRPRFDDSDMREYLINAAFTDVEHNDSSIVWGVPITRKTKILPLHPSNNESSEGYVYGHKQDSEAISKLEVPDDLKHMLGSLSDLWHATNDHSYINKVDDQKFEQVRSLLT